MRLELLAGIARHQRKAFHQPVQRPAATGRRPRKRGSRSPDWIERAADAGQRFAISDLLIASLAAEIGGLVWSLDKDFERMERLKLVSLYVPS